MSKNRRVIASPSLKHSLYTCCIHPQPFFSCSIAERKKKAKIKLSLYKYSLRLAFTRRRPTYTASFIRRQRQNYCFAAKSIQKTPIKILFLNSYSVMRQIDFCLQFSERVQSFIVCLNFIPRLCNTAMATSRSESHAVVN